MRLIMLTLTCCALLAATCKKTDQTNETTDTATPAADAYAMVTMKRSSCFGRCPVYEVRFYTDGTIEYVGKMNVERLGTWRTRMSEEEVDALRQKIHEVGFWDFSPEYPDDGTVVTDLPTTTIVVRVGDMMKEVREKHGAPRTLKDFEKYLDGLLEGRDWTQVGDAK